MRLNCDKIRRALQWLKSNNSKHHSIMIDEGALLEISEHEIRESKEKSARSGESSINGIFDEDNTCCSESKGKNNNSKDVAQEERERGNYGPIDEVALRAIEDTRQVGIEHESDEKDLAQMMKEILRPRKYRRLNMMPSYEAQENIAEYFPVLFPRGHGGASCIGGGIGLHAWAKHAFNVRGSRFAKHHDFLFFVNSVLRRKRISGLATHGNLRRSVKRQLQNIRDMVDRGESEADIEKRVECLMRSGKLNAQFERMKSTGAFWAELKRKSWSYLTCHGPCQIFMTLSAADVLDPNVYMQIKPGMTRKEALALSAKSRGELLAQNPVAAQIAFNRRVEALFKHALFGKTKIFGIIDAYLGRIEQQSRMSPHIHLLLWLKKKAPTAEDGVAVAEFAEMFSTAMLPPDQLISKECVESAQEEQSMHVIERSAAHAKPRIARSDASYKILGKQINENGMCGLRDIIIACNAHRCSKYCLKDGHCKSFFPHALRARAALALSSSDPRKARLVSLLPQCDPYINGTNPFIACISHANSDVTVMQGSGVRQSCYAVAYGVKGEKEKQLDSKSAKRLLNMEGSRIEDDAALLGFIARSAESSKIAGGQEAAGFLLGHDVVCKSHNVLRVDSSVLLNEQNALSPAEEIEHAKWRDEQDNGPRSVLDLVESEQHLRKDNPKEKTNEHHNNLDNDDQFKFSSKNTLYQAYIDRPHALENLSLTQFTINYATKEVKTSSLKNHSMTMSGSQSKLKEEITLIACKRRRASKSLTESTYMLDAWKKGKVDDSSVWLAASALLLHAPHRSGPNLLKGMTIQRRHQELLDSQDASIAFKNCAQWSHEISESQDLMNKYAKWIDASSAVARQTDEAEGARDMSEEVAKEIAEGLEIVMESEEGLHDFDPMTIEKT